ncbi:MAG: AAA family ATPase [Caldilineaceae bacterium]
MHSPTTPSPSEPTAAPCLTIRLLGDFALTYQGQPITAVNTPRLQALFTYLLLHHQAPQERRRLAFRFWPDSSEAQALTNLRKHLLHLKDALPAVDQMLVINRQTVQWLPQMPVTLDVAEFQALLAQVEQCPSEQALPLLRQAVELYQGELLPGCYDEWLLPFREALQAQYFTALDRLSTLLEEQRAYAEAIQVSQQRLRHDALHEATYRRLIRLHALNGDRAAALRVYHTCVTQLREELGVDPDAETQMVYERLLHGAAVTGPQPEMVANAPFIGRQHEWQRLQECWRLALHGQPQFVLLAGEAGIGKTRLAEELLNWAAHQCFCTVRSRCYAAEGRLTYAPIIEWLRSDVLRPHCSKVAATWLTELARLLPELLADQPALPRPEPISPTWQRHHLFEAVTRALLALDQPLILLIDDLQWCDKETLELLHFLLRNATTLSRPKVLLVGTARLPDEVDATHPLYELLNPLRSGNTLTQLDLVRLTESETDELARQMAEYTLDSQSLHQLFSDTAGNPLFVVETMRVRQGQSPHPNPPQGEGIAPLLSLGEGEAIRQYLPPKVLVVIQARLGQLSPTARELCEWAAIVGRAFTLELLINASKIAADKAVNALDELWQRRIIREQGNDAYDFSHDRIRDVAAAGISRVRRRYLHRCVAEALELESTGQLDNIAAQIAAHYDAAGVVAKAIEFYHKAAKVALRIYANQEAIGHLQQALALLAQLPTSLERDRQEIELQILLAAPIMTLKYYHAPEAEAAYKRAYLLSTQLGDSIHPTILRGLAGIALMRGAHLQADQWAKQMLTLAQQLGEPVHVVEAYYMLGVNCFWLGDLDLSLQYLETALAHFNAQQQWEHITRYAQDPKSICLQRLGYTLWYRGYPDRAEQAIDAAINCAQELSHPFSLGYVLTFSLIAAIDCDNFDRAQVLAERAHAFLAQYDFPHWQSMVAVPQSYLIVIQGRVYQGISQMRDGLAIFYDRGTRNIWPFFLGLLARAYSLINEFDEGLAILAEALKAVEQQDERSYEAELYRLRGALLLQADGQNSGSTTQAEACFFKALEIAHQQNAKVLELRAAMSLANLWDRQGKREEARELLAEVYNWFTEGFDAADLREARLLLKELTN